MKIRYFDIAWLSRHDGPGHRVVLFLQGCHLACPWCHSPHSRPARSPLLWFRARCRACGECERACPNGVHRITGSGHELRRESCTGCGRCIDACPESGRTRSSGALFLPTRDIAVRELWDILLPQLDLVRDIGGLTVSGGEALLQAKALRALLLLCREEGIHVAVETSGTLPVERIEAVADLVDCWLFGLRPSPDYTPPGHEHIAANLEYLRRTGREVIIRVPVIAGVTDHPDSVERIAATMHASAMREVQLLPFHRGSAHYHDASGSAYPYGESAIPPAHKLGEIRDFLQGSGLHASILP